MCQPDHHLQQAQLLSILQTNEKYFNKARPYQWINQYIPYPAVIYSICGRVERQDILGSILHDYYRAACLPGNPSRSHFLPLHVNAAVTGLNIPSILTAFIGAVILLAVVRAVRRAPTV